MERKDDYRWTDSERSLLIVTVTSVTNIVWKLIDTHRCTHPGPENVLRTHLSFRAERSQGWRGFCTRRLWRWYVVQELEPHGSLTLLPWLVPVWWATRRTRRSRHKLECIHVDVVQTPKTRYIRTIVGTYRLSTSHEGQTLPSSHCRHWCLQGWGQEGVVEIYLDVQVAGCKLCHVCQLVLWTALTTYSHLHGIP